MGRSPSNSEKVGLKKGPWTPEEDQKLVSYIEQHGHGTWRALPAKAGLQRCEKSCRLRWINYLRPDIKRGKFSLKEDQTIIQLHALLGNKWSLIAAQLPNRTDNEIKNYWNTNLKKRLARMGVDPITHKRKITDVGSGGSHPDDAANLSHTVQWESARLEAEARLTRESKLQVQNQLASFSSSPPTRLVINRIPARPSLPPCLDVLKAWQQSSCSSGSSATGSSPKQNNRVHNMYAIMLATATDDLESPSSTLSFPESKHLQVEPFNDISLPPTTNPATVAQFAETCKVNNAVKVVETSDNEDAEHGTLTGLQDDDVLVAVEAFRAARDDMLSYDCTEKLDDGYYWANSLNSTKNAASGSPVLWWY